MKKNDYLYSSFMFGKLARLKILLIRGIITGFFLCFKKPTLQSNLFPLLNMNLVKKRHKSNESFIGNFIFSRND